VALILAVLERERERDCRYKLVYVPDCMQSTAVNSIFLCTARTVEYSIWHNTTQMWQLVSYHINTTLHEHYVHILFLECVYAIPPLYHKFCFWYFLTGHKQNFKILFKNNNYLINAIFTAAKGKCCEQPS
jgi:hypothetical protein